MKNILLYLTLMAFAGCSNNDNDSYFCDANNTSPAIKIKNVDFEKVDLDTAIVTSYDGITFLRGSRIMFADRNYALVYELDTNGSIIKRHLGKGKSLAEFPTSYIETIIQDEKNNLYILGSSFDWTLYDSTFHRNTEGLRLLNVKTTDSNPDIYKRFDTFAFMYAKFNAKIYGSNIYFPILGNNRKVINCFMPHYQKETKLFARVDIANAEIVELMGRMTPEFEKIGPTSLLHFSFDIDQDNGDMYINYEIDSLMYVYDKNYKIKTAYGYAGKEMNLNYEPINSENRKERYFPDRESYGYYDDVKILNGRVFRSYKKGNHTPFDGLQIYENGVLIADVPTPKEIKVRGYIAPYYYCDIICNPDDETLTLFRFKL